MKTKLQEQKRTSFYIMLAEFYDKEKTDKANILCQFK